MKDFQVFEALGWAPLHRFASSKWQVAFNSIISACAAASLWQEALEIFGFLETAGASLGCGRVWCQETIKTMTNLHMCI